MKRRFVMTLILATAMSTTAAAAAGLTTSSERLTTFTSTSEVPVRTCTLASAADAYIDELSNLLNFGTGSTLHVQSLALADKRSLARFDLAGCSLPTGASVQSAALRLTVTTAPASSRTYNVHRSVEAWTETGVTWSNQPAMASSASASAAVGTTAGAVVEWDVTSDVQAFVAGTATNHGWRVRDSDEDAALVVETRFAAREHSTADARPRLVVRWKP